MFPQPLLSRAEALLAAAQALGLKLTTAESCTGGLVAALLTEIAGSSAVFDRGFVTYSNQAKTEVLGVPAEMLARDGAVSETTARAMAGGARARSGADIAVSITGIAGPGGGSADKPVGLVHFACQAGGTCLHVERRFTVGGRHSIRMAAVDQALTLLEAAVGGSIG